MFKKGQVYTHNTYGRLMVAAVSSDRLLADGVSFDRKMVHLTTEAVEDGRLELILDAEEDMKTSDDYLDELIKETGIKISDEDLGDQGLTIIDDEGGFIVWPGSDQGKFSINSVGVYPDNIKPLDEQIVALMVLRKHLRGEFDV